MECIIRISDNGKLLLGPREDGRNSKCSSSLIRSFKRFEARLLQQARMDVVLQNAENACRLRSFQTVRGRKVPATYREIV